MSARRLPTVSSRRPRRSAGASRTCSPTYYPRRRWPRSSVFSPRVAKLRWWATASMTLRRSPKRLWRNHRLLDDDPLEHDLTTGELHEGDTRRRRQRGSATLLARTRWDPSFTERRSSRCKRIGIARQADNPREVDGGSFRGSPGWYVRRTVPPRDGYELSSRYMRATIARQTEDPRKADGGSS